MNGLEVRAKWSEIAGKKRKPPVGFSALYPLYCVFNQIYVQGHQCVRGRLIVLQSGGDNEEMLRVLGRKGKGGASPGACGDWHLCTNISSLCCGLSIHLYSHTVLNHTTSSSNRQKETWGGHLRGTAQSEKCPCWAIFPELRSSFYKTN